MRSEGTGGDTHSRVDEDDPESSGSVDEVEAGPVAAGRIVAGTYRVVRVLGRGSMGTVYEVEHLRLGKVFALKLMRSEELPGTRARRRFISEAHLLAAIDSDHVVSVIDSGEDSGTPFLVMERLVGADLRRILEEARSMPVSRALRIALGAARGLRAVHAAGLVHRDLKPANLFVASRDGRDVAKILDFGVARSEAGNGTSGGALVGTIRYMAPEQLMDGTAVGPHTDVYAVGAVLYECLAGRAAHTGATVEELMFGILNRQPSPLGSLRAEISPELEALVACTMHRRPERRCTAAEFCDRLRALPDFDSGVRGDGTTRDESLWNAQRIAVPTKPEKRSRARLGAAALALLGLGFGTGHLGDSPGGPRAEILGKGAPPAEPAVRTEARLPETRSTPEPEASAGLLAPSPGASAAFGQTPDRAATASSRPTGTSRTPISSRIQAKPPRLDTPFDDHNPYVD